MIESKRARRARPTTTKKRIESIRYFLCLFDITLIRISDRDELTARSEEWVWGQYPQAGGSGE